MPWIQTRDIVNLSKDFYKQLRFIYEELKDQNDVQRLGMVLDAVHRHVQYLEKELKALEKDIHPEVMDAWFQFSPEPPELNTDPTERIRPDMTVDDALRIILDFDTALSEFYQRVADATEFQGVQELFVNLKNSIDTEKEKLALDASGLKML